MKPMNAQDLRIGNWVYNNDNVKVTSKQIDLFDEGIYNLRAIPLTEEWLLKFGFHKDNYGLYFKVKNNAPFKSGCEIEFCAKNIVIDDKFVWEICKDFKLTERPIHYANIEHVHQLQNLFYALTNKELVYKE